MPKPIITDKDVISLVRKELERKIANYCEKHGIELDNEDEQDEDGSTDVADDDDDDNLGKRKPSSGKKPENLDVSTIMKSIGLRITHRDSGLEYYVREVYPGKQLIDLESPEGTRFQVDFNEVEQEYKLG